jgi:hypothetical protein
MPNQAPTIPSYGKPIDHHEAPTPNFRPMPMLQHPRQQRPLNSIMKKMMQKLPKGKMKLSPPKNRRLKKQKYY